MNERCLCALRQFGKLDIDYETFLRECEGVVELRRNGPDYTRKVVFHEPMETVIPLTRDDVKAVLGRYLDGKLDATALADWANLIMLLDIYDIGPGEAEKVSEVLRDVVFRLANSVLYSGVSREVVKHYQECVETCTEPSQ